MSATLAIPADCLAAPNRLHVAAIEVMMLWPPDESARDEALASSSVECLSTIADQLPREGLLTLASLQRETARIKDVQEKSRARFLDGVRAAKYFQETVGLISINRPTKMSSIAAQVATGLSPVAPAIDVKTFENHVWKKYRPVAHLWAASLDLNFEKADIGAKPEFPCHAEELGQFLAVAEAYRVLGERTRARQSRHTVLEGLIVEAITLKFQAREHV